MANVAIEVLSGGASGRVVRLDADVIRIGRSAGAEVELPEPHVSADHARLLVGSEQVVLEDLDSTNGTWVVRGGARIRVGEGASRLIVQDGDELELGGEGEHGTRLRLGLSPDRETGQLLAVRPVAEVAKSAAALDEAPRLRALLAELAHIGAADEL
ncbi:MAG TPA: FHA domain-containing protein, partial [Polyangiaceae bacterium]|nr:FHA domain-containing protein [Polyangiaceae bacterium]